MARTEPTTVTAALTIIAGFAGAQIADAGVSMVVPVSQDESVVSGFAEKNYDDNTNRGGLFVGSDGTNDIARFYLMFDFPETLKTAKIESAVLSAVYEDDLDRDDNGLHRIHFVSVDDWSEKTINWINQPGPAYGSPDALFDSASAKLGETARWDLTELVQSEAAGDGKLSLMFAAANESADRNNRNWEYFAEQEFNPAHAFRITVNATSTGTGGGVVPVPLPGAVLPAVLTSAGAAATAGIRRIRKRRKEASNS
ncbi:MAG TPA: DNRLRE domain-containing protein [Tepidisphaeraceae bacterium]|nr:DNRLRE domain-containing protein [Tepidisphaeraceae bacterium]